MMSGWIISLSNGLMRVERAVCALLVAFIAGLILLNVTTRSFGAALYWVDELAVYMMIWMALIGASVLLRERRHVAVTLLAGALADSRQRAVLVMIDFIVLVSAAALLLMCLAWYDPIGLMQSDFDMAGIAATTFNFIYEEPTNTLGLQKFWVWLVVPIVSFTLSVHGAANLLEDLGTGPGS